LSDFKLGQIVFSKSGRDKGEAFIVTQISGEFLYLANGSLRKLEKPKKKKIKHVQKTNFIDIDIGIKLLEKSYLLDSDIRKSIKNFKEVGSIV